MKLFLILFKNIYAKHKSALVTYLSKICFVRMTFIVEFCTSHIKTKTHTHTQTSTKETPTNQYLNNRKKWNESIECANKVLHLFRSQLI